VYQDPFATYNRLPLANLTAALPQVNFPEYFATFAPRRFPEHVVITYPAYPALVSEILNDTAAEVIEAYLVVRAALALSPNLGTTTEAWQAQRSLLETLTGIKKGAVGDRAEYCVGKVEQTLGFAAGRYFVNETFGGDSREKGTKVITGEPLFTLLFRSNLTVYQTLSTLSKPPFPMFRGWIRLRPMLLRKRLVRLKNPSLNLLTVIQQADAIRVKVGYPISPDTRDPASILRYYRDVTVKEDSYFENILSAA
jgi:endothelin-converting enzyme